MAIPRKNSRKIEVDGKNFRFLMKTAPGGKSVELPDGTYQDQAETVTTVQEDVERPGNVLQFRSPYGVPVAPTDVADAIRKGIKMGWVPSKRGAAVMVDIWGATFQ